MKRISLSNIVIVLSIALLIVHLFKIDYQDMSWKINKLHYSGIISMVLIITAMLSSNKESKKK